MTQHKTKFLILTTLLLFLGALLVCGSSFYVEWSTLPAHTTAPSGPALVTLAAPQPAPPIQSQPSLHLPNGAPVALRSYPTAGLSQSEQELHRQNVYLTDPSGNVIVTMPRSHYATLRRNPAAPRPAIAPTQTIQVEALAPARDAGQTPARLILNLIVNLLLAAGITILLIIVILVLGSDVPPLTSTPQPAPATAPSRPSAAAPAKKNTKLPMPTPLSYQPPGPSIPICSVCKRVRTQNGKWQAIDDLDSKDKTSNFSHGICPECTNRLYPDLQSK